MTAQPPVYSIQLSGSERRFSSDGQTLLLDAALAQGQSLPFSCRRGACGSCRAQIVSGRHRAPQQDGQAYPLGENELLLCQSVACSDMTLAFPGWTHADAPPARVLAEVVEKRLIAADVALLLLRPAGVSALTVRAGQHARLFMDDGDSRFFSIANLPSAAGGVLEFHIRLHASSRFSDFLRHRLGSTLALEGPLGVCVWRPGDEAEIVLCATGTGYAGVKAMLLTALARPGTAPVTLYWGGRVDADLYDRVFLDELAASFPAFRWVPVLSSAPGGRRVQEVAAAAGHDWSRARVIACGHPDMVREARAHLINLGLPARQFDAEVFTVAAVSVDTPATPERRALDPLLERVGARFSLEGMLRARSLSIRAVAQIGARLEVGMRAADALAMAHAHLRAMGASHTWHPTYIRFGEDTAMLGAAAVDLQRRLGASDIAVVDIGPVWDGLEGDFGDTFVTGDNLLHRQCARAAKTVFDDAALAWRRGLTGRALYAHASRFALSLGWILQLDMPGHRLSDFPHALFGRSRLAELDISPGDAVWVLEIQLRHPTQKIGAFYEDILSRAVDVPIQSDGGT